MSKIQIAALNTSKEALLQFLQEEEVLHVAPTDDASLPQQESNTSYQLAHMQFALEFLDRVRAETGTQKKKSLRTLFSPKPVATLQDLEKAVGRLQLDELLQATRETSDALTHIEADIATLTSRVQSLLPWKNLVFRNGDYAPTPPIQHLLISVYTRDDHNLFAQLSTVPTLHWQEVDRVSDKNGSHLYLEMILHERDREVLDGYLQDTNAEIVTLHLEQGESVTDALRALKTDISNKEREYRVLLQKSTTLLDKENDLRFAYDALLHRHERDLVQSMIHSSAYTTIITGWIPTAWIPKLRKRIAHVIPEAAIEEIDTEQDEKPPITFVNSKTFRPFEAVTNIYGKPAYQELDPSAPLSLFFLIAFGLALTDAGYGLVIMAGMFVAEKFFRLKRDMRNMVRLLFYAGFATTVIGALTGGWFGIALDELEPGPVRDTLLSIRLMDPVSDPITLLLIVFAFGIAQLLFAWMVRGWHNWKQGSVSNIFLDDIPWITMVVSILIWAGAAQEMVNPAIGSYAGWFAVANAVYLIFTQGRSHKNPLLRIGAGTISLYGLVSFMSDTLSYSRLLALGLATAIIGFVVNLIAAMVSTTIPVVGIVLAVFVLLVGHAFNLGINTLGAFIHSGRLQFVEFFPKFMEGGGVPFKPFGRISKYVDNPKEFT